MKARILTVFFFQLIRLPSNIWKATSFQMASGWRHQLDVANFNGIFRPRVFFLMGILPSGFLLSTIYCSTSSSNYITTTRCVIWCLLNLSFRLGVQRTVSNFLFEINEHDAGCLRVPENLIKLISMFAYLITAMSTECVAAFHTVNKTPGFSGMLTTRGVTFSAIFASVCYNDCV